MLLRVRFIPVLFALVAGMGARAATPDAPAAIDEKAAREFLVRAKAADALTDPLARCLAFPDFPGNQWPTGLAAAHCQLQFGPRVLAADLHRALDGNDLSGIEFRFAADLDRHFSDTDFSEAIHRDFDLFDGYSESDALSQAWLAKAPDSAFAIAARADHFRWAVDNLRAGRVFDDIPPDQFETMKRLAAQSRDLFRQALTIEPRLIEAYAGLVQVSRLVSRSEDEADALAKGMALDPGCEKMGLQLMQSVSPMWGGTVEHWQAAAAALAPRLPQRPLLALAMQWPATYAAERAWRKDDYANAIQLAEHATRFGSNPEAFLTMAVALRRDQTVSPLIPTAYAVAETRFESDPEGALMRGGMLLENLGDPAWALPALQLAVEHRPDSGDAHYMLGNDYVALGRVDDAQREYLLAMRDDATRGVSARALSKLYTAHAPQVIDPGTWIRPAEAIDFARAAVPAGKVGAFVMKVVASGNRKGWIYLNSAPDYRSPDNLTVSLTPGAVLAMTLQLGGDPEAALRDKYVLVTGVVQRVPIFSAGAPQGDGRVPLYFQTQIEVSEPAQLRVVDPPTRDGAL